MNAQQLKNAILQEAIEGRLVPQDPNDEPASILLARIRKEKERLVKEGKLKKKDLEVKPISEDEIPFEIPDSWEWVRLGDIIEFVNGRAYKKDELLDRGKYKVLRVGNFFTNDSWYYSDLELPDDKYCYRGDLLYAWSASFGPKIWEGEKTIFHYHIWNVKFPNTVLWREYLYYFFLADMLKVKQSTTGSTMIHVSMENMKPRLIPLPPLAEQHRIVAKIEELLPKVEEYGKAQDELNKLNAELPERLKKSILQEAIEGRLVPQDPNDEPASVLLAKIRKEKEQLIKEKKIILSKPEKAVKESGELPFVLPSNWTWALVNDVCRVFGRIGFRGYTTNDLRDSKEGAAISLSPSNMINGVLDFSSCTYISDEKYEESPEIQIKNGDILIVKTGSSYGKTSIVKNLPWKSTINPQIAVVKDIKIDVEYLKDYFQSSYAQSCFKSFVLGTSIPTFSQLNLISMRIPLPPLAEQHRIVAKIEEIFAEIDKLKK